MILMKACVDKNLCISCGLCTAISSNVFFMDDDGLAVAANEELVDTLLDAAKDAEGQCPAAAIKVE
jgi:ferredoxin